MTYREKLGELKNQSLEDQKAFLKIIEEIRIATTKGEPLEEEKLFLRDKLYNQFNKVLKEHRRLLNHLESNNISMDLDYPEVEQTV